MIKLIDTESKAGAARRKRSRRERPKLNLNGWIGLVIVGLGVLVAVIGPFVAPHDPGDILVWRAYAGPGDGIGFMGADALGRDVLSRLLHGAHLTIGIAFIANVLSFGLGMVIGFAAAEIRGRADDFITWLIDVFISFPPIMMALIVIVALGSDIYVLIGTIALVSAPRIARVARAVAMNVAVLDFVEVARARGESLPSLLVREILPNTLRPLAVEFGLRLTFAILFLSSLSFLGLGIQPPAADWGSMVRENLSGVLLGSPAPLLPAIGIGVLTIGVNLLVDWMSSQSGRGISEELTQ
jgi:peptide/nickel transport system permease protein